MDVRSFISELVSSVAWPLTVIGVAILLRPSLASLLADVKELRFRGLEATFERDLATARRIADEAEDVAEVISMPMSTQDERLVRLAEISPRAIIIEAWAELESAARSALSANQGQRPPTAGILGDLLLERGVFDEAGFQIYSILRALRNRVAHEAEYSLAAGEALEYAGLARSLAERLREREQ